MGLVGCASIFLEVLSEAKEPRAHRRNVMRVFHSRIECLASGDRHSCVSPTTLNHFCVLCARPKVRAGLAASRATFVSLAVLLPTISHRVYSAIPVLGCCCFSRAAARRALYARQARTRTATRVHSSHYATIYDESALCASVTRLVPSKEPSELAVLVRPLPIWRG